MNSKLLLILPIVLVLLVSGCAQGPGAGSQNPTSAPAKPVPAIRITSPVEGQAFSAGDSVTVTYTTTNFEVIPVNRDVPKEDGRGHVHAFLDGANEQRGPKTAFVFEGLTAGQHKLKLELHNHDHSAVEGAQPSEVTIEVSTGSATPPAAAPAPSPTPTPVAAPTPSPAPVTTAAKEFSMEAKQFEFTPSTITVKKGDTVKLHVKSTDVTHGFSLPDFNVNENLAPGKTVDITFTADKAGPFSFFCSFFCGSGHSTMRGTLIVE